MGGRGPITSTAGAVTGIYTPRNSVAPLGRWAIPTVPLSLFGFFSFTSSASTRSLLAVGYGALQALDTYGARGRMVRAYVDGTARSAESGTWSAGEAVRGMVVTSTTVSGYDAGAKFADSAPYSGAGVAYPAPYSRVSFMGDPDSTPVSGAGYWLGIWARELSAGEVHSLSEAPFQLLRARSRRFVVGASGIPANALWLDSVGGFVRAGSAGSNKRMHLMADGSMVASAAAVPGGKAMQMDAAGHWGA